MSQNELRALLTAIDSLLCNSKIEPKELHEVLQRMWIDFKKSQTWKLMKRKEKERHKMIYKQFQIFFEALIVL